MTIERKYPKIKLQFIRGEKMKSKTSERWENIRYINSRNCTDNLILRRRSDDIIVFSYQK